MFASAGAASSKKEDFEGIQAIKNAIAPKSKAPDASRASQGRQKPAVNKFAELTKDLRIELEKDDGVVVN